MERFRTSTGRKYGPDFIDLGLKIGEALYSKLEKKFARSPASSGDLHRRISP